MSAAKTIAKLGMVIGANTEEFETALARSERKFKTFGKQLTKTGKSMSVAVTAPLTLIGAKSVMASKDFELAMAKVAAVSGATGAVFDDLETSAKELGRTTVFSASEVSALQLEYAKLGFSAASINQVTKSTLNLAQAFDQDLGQTAAVVGSTLAQFNMDASETSTVADVMATAFSGSALDLEKFSEGMKNVAPVANEFGFSLQETSALLGVLANNGISGSDAGTKLKMALSELAAAGVPVRETFKKLIAGGTSYTEAIDVLGKRAAILAPVFGRNLDDLSALNEKFEGAAGSAEMMADKMNQTTAGALAGMSSAIEGLQIAIGDALAPIIQRVAAKITEWAQAFTNLSPTMQRVVVAVGAVAASVGPLLLAFGYLNTNVLPGLSGAFKLAGAAMGSFKAKAIPAVIGALQKLWAVMLANPVLAIIAGVTALGAALYAVTKQFDGMSAAQRAVADVNKTAAQAVAGERAELEQLISVARNNNLSLETRQKAIKKLNEVSPEYLSNLSLENINTKEATNALDNYVKSLERRARVTAAQERLVEIERDLIEAENDLKDGPNFWEKVAGAINPLPGMVDAATIAQASYNKTVSDLTSQKEALLGILTETQTGLDAITSSGSNAAASLNNVAAAAQGVGQPINMSAAGVIGPSTIDGPTIGAPTLQTDGVGEFQGYTADSNLLLDTLDEIGITTEQVGESFATLGTRVGDAFANMGRDGQSAFQALANSVREAMGEIINALVAKAVSGVIANSFASLPPPVAAGVAAGFAGVAKGLFNSLVPAFAQGGLVTGPMLAMVGDNPSGKEAIIPFEKMGAFLNMAGGGNQNVQVAGQFRLQGNDLVAVIDRTSQRRQNTI